MVILLQGSQEQTNGLPKQRNPSPLWSNYSEKEGKFQDRLQSCAEKPRLKKPKGEEKQVEHAMRSKTVSSTLRGSAPITASRFLPCLGFCPNSFHDGLCCGSVCETDPLLAKSLKTTVFYHSSRNPSEDREIAEREARHRPKRSP